jgi:hypothetical protein
MKEYAPSIGIYIMSTMLPIWMASKTVLRKTVGYFSSMRYDGSVGDFPADICEVFADLFESVHNVETCDSDTAFGFACPI